jgi:hypothetical protein
MPPHVDDAGITNQICVLRALPNWVTLDNGRERPKSEAFTDSSFENSCFVEGEISIDDIVAFLLDHARRQEDHRLIEQIENGLAFARISVSVIRENGFIIERRPDEAPGCTNPAAHVVVGPPEEIRRKVYERAAKAIVKHPLTTIIRHIIRQG